MATDTHRKRSKFPQQVQDQHQIPAAHPAQVHKEIITATKIDKYVKQIHA